MLLHGARSCCAKSAKEAKNAKKKIKNQFLGALGFLGGLGAKASWIRVASIKAQVALSHMKLIITADDFGRSPEINAAVLEAHRRGILTSASLMVAGAAASEAVDIARANPTLAVGLHVVLVDGATVLPADQLDRIVDHTGRLPNSPASLGFRYAMSSAARSQARAEMTAQFDRFAQTGLPLSHVDGHQHLHLHPAIFPPLCKLAKQHRAKGVRIVRDDWRFALRYEKKQAILKTVWATAFTPLARVARKQALGSGLTFTNRAYGLMQSGRMTEDYVLALLEHLHRKFSSAGDDFSAEIYFHPTTGHRTDALGPNPDELQTLLSPAVRAKIEQYGMRLARYADCG